MPIIRHLDRGIVIAGRDFGRGSDIRFSVDSHVIVSFTPISTEELNQLSGRSSRTMKTHHCDVIIHDTRVYTESFKDWLEARSYHKLSDGLKILNVLRGMRMEKDYTDDQRVLSLFRKGWI